MASVCQCGSVTVCQCISVSVYQCVSVSVYQCISVSVYQCISVSVYQCVSVSVYQCISVSVYRKPTTKGILPLRSLAAIFASQDQPPFYSAAGFQFWGKSSCSLLTL